MCNKAVGNYPYALEFVPGCYNTREMCDKAVDTYPSIIKFVPKCSKTKEVCHRAVHGCSFVFDVIFDKYKIQELWNLVVSLYIPFIVYFPNNYITQEMRDEAC